MFDSRQTSMQVEEKILDLFHALKPIFETIAMGKGIHQRRRRRDRLDY